jgi:hypothetical protein
MLIILEFLSGLFYTILRINKEFGGIAGENAAVYVSH